LKYQIVRQQIVKTANSRGKNPLISNIGDEKQTAKSQTRKYQTREYRKTFKRPNILAILLFLTYNTPIKITLTVKTIIRDNIIPVNINPYYVNNTVPAV